MKLVYLMYNRRTCVTGKALFDELTSRNINGFYFRRCNANPPRQHPDVVLRWGNSLHEVPRESVEMNNREAIANTTDKLRMLQILAETEGVEVPPFATSSPYPADENSNVFIRDRNDHVRYGNVATVNATDKYAMRPIEKVREFRVHVFQGRTIGIYEKIPNDPSVKIYKNETCDFRRVDQSSRDAMEGLRGMRPMARAAVEALGLLFGGVDVLLDARGNFYVTEVNSSPALNEPNLKRWGDSIEEYLTSLDQQGETNQETEQELRAREEERQREEARQRELERERVRAARRATHADLVSRMRVLAESEGFEIRTLDLTDTVVTQ